MGEEDVKSLISSSLSSAERENSREAPIIFISAFPPTVYKWWSLRTLIIHILLCCQAFLFFCFLTAYTQFYIETQTTRGEGEACKVYVHSRHYFFPSTSQRIKLHMKWSVGNRERASEWERERRKTLSTRKLGEGKVQKSRDAIGISFLTKHSSLTNHH